MARSLKKGFYTHKSLIEKVNRLKKEGKKKAIKTWCRSSMIIPDFIGYTFLVHNGKDHIPVYVKEDMIGHKLGEFSQTRKIGKHGNTKGK